MSCFRTLFACALALGALSACGSSDGASAPIETLTTSTVLDLSDVKTNPTDYEWFDFRPNVKKLILAGTAETKHVAILWYTVEDGAVGLHYHGQTESVYVIDGTQTDAKGSYPTGTAYFNPPRSGHEISDSSGFFVLAYAAPPDFTSTDEIEPYTPLRIDTEASDLLETYPFEAKGDGISVFPVPLDSEGGLSAELIEVSGADSYPYTGNYVLVLKGSCDIEGKTLAEDSLVVAKAVEPELYRLAPSKDSTCLAMGVSF